MEDFVFRNNGTAAPRHHPSLLRTDICRLLDEAVQSPLVTVVAGAGYGKTQAVSAFLQGYGAADIWLQLSFLDNMGESFWDKFIKAISVRNKAFASKLVPIGFPESERQFEQFLAVLRGELSPNRKHIFVFDDFHLIQNRLVLRFVERLSALCLPNVSVVLLSRMEPRINIISQLAKGLVFQINETDLRFKKEEMFRYFKLLGITLEPQAATDMYDETDGWVFAICLLGLSLKNGTLEESRALEAMKTNIFKLIEAEVFLNSSERLQKFLVGLSLIDHWSPELLAELSRDPALIGEMQTISSLIRYDSYANEYRIHHLFFAYLQQKQELLSDAEKREIYTKAAGWCARNGYQLDAVVYYEKVGNYGGIAEVAYTLVRMTPGRVADFLLDVLNRIPEQAFREHVELYIVKNKLLQTLTRFDDARLQAYDIIEQYEALPGTPKNDWLLSECYWNLGYIGLFTALHTNIRDYTDLFEKGHAYFLRSGRMVKGPRERALVSSYVARTGYPAEKGALEWGNEWFSRYANYAIEDKNGLMNGMMELADCEVAYFKANLKRAEGLAYQATRKARESEQFQTENRALFFLLRIHIHKGNPERVRDILQQMKAQLDNEEFLNGYTLYDITVGWFFAQIRQTDRIADWLKSDFDRSELSPMLQSMEDLVRAKCCFAERRYPAALAALEGQDTEYGMEAFLLGKLELLTLRAVCTYHTGDKKEAVRILQEAYQISAPDELDMPFIELGKDMRTLTAAAMKAPGCGIPRLWLETTHKKSSTYAKTLSYMISEYRIFHRLNDKAYTLSNREKEILTDLCHGLSRTEIACNRTISLSTVKTLIQSVYTKLGTQNTAETIWIAARFKLVE
ncbi:MAG: LuxR C-terminal-related transcriptional regulator [Oscillospiraceae bacterium]|nr:LuxR C-terminal-related transcriptional regulator [Oscillospiraceae bacterium]